LLCLGLLWLFSAGAFAAGGAPRGPFAVWAIGLPNGYVIMEHQTPAVQITAEDVKRGVLDVRDGSRFVVTTHTPSGYTVDFRAPGPSTLIQGVLIEGISRAVEFGPAGGTVVEVNTVAGRRIVTVNYRFSLAPDTTPGTYAWPLTLVVRAPAPSDLALLAGARNTVTGSARHTAHDPRDTILIGRGEP
jgi:hypothetical protein